MQKEDGTSYNDFRILTLESKKDNNEEQEWLSMVDTLKGYGKTIADGVVVGGFGAYIVEDPDYEYYLCRWTEEPYVAEKDEEVDMGEGEQKVKVYKNDWICRGKWLQKLPRADGWWTMTDRSCLVRMQEVVHCNVPLRERSETNRFRSRTPRETVRHADEHGAWRIDQSDHDYIVLQGQHIDGMDYTDDIFEDVDAAIMEDEDEEDREEEMSSEDEDNDDNSEEEEE